MRDSTWYPVGPKNTQFRLAKRDVPNGVQIIKSSCAIPGRPESRGGRAIAPNPGPGFGENSRESSSSIIDNDVSAAPAGSAAGYSVAADCALEEARPSPLDDLKYSLSYPSCGGKQPVTSASGLDQCAGWETGPTVAAAESNLSELAGFPDDYKTPKAMWSSRVMERGGRPGFVARARGGEANTSAGRCAGNTHHTDRCVGSGTDGEGSERELLGSSKERGGGECAIPAAAPAAPTFSENVGGACCVIHRINLSLSDQQRQDALVASAAGLCVNTPQVLASPSLSRASGPVRDSDSGSKAAAAAAAAVMGVGKVGGRQADVVQIRCRADPNTDMFQMGRMQGPENDFEVKGPLHQPTPGGKVCGPVSRHAVRFLVDRQQPHRCRIFTGGFNGR